MPNQMNDSAARSRAVDDAVADRAIEPVAADEIRSMLDAAQRAVGHFRQQAPWQTKQMPGMRADVSWNRSTGRHAAPYRALLSGGNGA